MKDADKLFDGSDAHLIDEFEDWAEVEYGKAFCLLPIAEMKKQRASFTAGRALGKREGMVKAAEVIKPYVEQLYETEGHYSHARLVETPMKEILKKVEAL